jgi:hypothetical protein
MPQNKTNQWIQTLLPVLQTVLQRNGDAPARRWEEWTEQVQGSEATPLLSEILLAYIIEPWIATTFDSQEQKTSCTLYVR